MVWYFVRNCIPSVKPCVKDTEIWAAKIWHDLSHQNQLHFPRIRSSERCYDFPQKKRNTRWRRIKRNTQTTTKPFQLGLEVFFFFKYRYIPDRSASRYTVPTLQLRLLGLTSKMVEEHRDSTQFLIFITLHASLISRTSLHHLHFNQGTKLDTVCLCKLGVLFLTKLSGKSAVKQHSSGEKKKKMTYQTFL